ncbi:hypothetical protein RN001_005928 [Aquatica leii]|uniref:Uncharacterized protein n=1 Tax=Aquatica leii TaxID=1421715 RepID=A0AAN7PCZ4_9COLE|nr:hypothetical protein RN001_005928 [Aquatica leii]
MKNQSLFQKKLAELFDITDQKNLQSIDHDQKIFLEGQKSLNRRGIISLSSQPVTEADVMIVDEINQPVKDKQIPIIRQESDIIISQSSASLTSKSVSDFENELTPPITTKINVMTPELVAALDRSNVSSLTFKELEEALNESDIDLSDENDPSNQVFVPSSDSDDTSERLSDNSENLEDKRLESDMPLLSSVIQRSDAVFVVSQQGQDIVKVLILLIWPN